jgi:hypothetical protein
MINLLQTQDAMTTALDPTMDLEAKLFNESQLGNSTDPDDASPSSSDSEEQKFSESESSSGSGVTNTVMKRFSTSSENQILSTGNDGNYSYL